MIELESTRPPLEAVSPGSVVHNVSRRGSREQYNRSVKSVRSLSRFFAPSGRPTAISIKGLFPHRILSKPRVVPAAARRSGSGSRAEASRGDAVAVAITTPAPSTVPSYSDLFLSTGLRRAFPLFRHNKHYQEYRSWQRRTVMVEGMVFMIVAIVIPNMFTRYSWQWFGPYTESLWHFLSKLLFLPLIGLFAVQIVSHIFMQFYPDEEPEDALGMEIPVNDDNMPHPSLSHWGLSMRTMVLWMIDRQIAVEDWTMYVIIALNAAVFIARVKYGACPSGWDKNVWLSQICNPVEEWYVKLPFFPAFRPNASHCSLPFVPATPA